MAASGGRYRLARFETLLNDCQLLLGCPPPAADITRQQFNVSIRVRHKPVPKPVLEPFCLCRLSGRKWGQFRHCALVVEVKHYKRTAKKSFSEVMTDYPAAHPNAPIVLVNYGPIGDILNCIPLSAKARCVTVEHLTVLNRRAREEFRDLVRKVIGRPVRAALEFGGTTRAKRAVAVDVSRSMAPVLSDPRFSSALAATAVAPHASEIFPIDRRVHTAVSVEQAVERLHSIQGDINALEAPVTELLGTYEEVIVLTDGLNDLSTLRSASEEFAAGSCFRVTVRRPEST